MCIPGVFPVEARSPIAKVRGARCPSDIRGKRGAVGPGGEGVVGLAAISAVMLIVTRNFDLSVGSAVALIGVVVALLTVKFNVDPIVAVLVCLCVGLLMGAWQGWWVTRMKVSSFIVTLAGMLYFRGISMIASRVEIDAQASQ